MNDYFGSIIQNKAQPMVDFNCNNQSVRNPRKSMFQIFTPKNNKKNSLANNPKDIFNANKELNLILSKNLKSIYKENQKENVKDAPLFENVNCLIKNNKKSNQNNYKKFLNSKKLSYNMTNNFYNHLKANNIKKNFQHSAIVRSKNKLMNDIRVRNSLKKTVDVGKRVNFFQFQNKKEKEKEKEFGFKIEKEEAHKKKPIL